MAPSRGSSTIPPKSSGSTEAQDTALIDAQSNTALTSFKRSVHYLYSPTSTDPSLRPTRLRTRAFLRAFRSLTIFVFWRCVRYAKYVAIASLVGTVGAGVFGSLFSGVGFLLAPTGIAGTIIAASVWGVGRWGARRLSKRWIRGKGYGDFEMEVEASRSAPMRTEVGAEAMPW